jgi:hypothetical protein
MAINLPPRRDLTLIFERDDVHAAFTEHCRNRYHPAEHPASCQLCSQLRIILAVAITEWQAICELDDASRR